MPTGDPIQTLLLQEFRLLAADADGAAARIVAASPSGFEPSIPLLTSIDDRRDVATLRALHEGEPADTDAAQHAALDSLVASWEPPKHYGARMTERSERPSSYFRLAVTESGINTPGIPPVTLREASAGDATTSRPAGLIWIGEPVGTYAGLLVLLGSYDEPVRRGPAGWPLPLSRELGVRIYENSPQ
ncbi:MAG TPA: hypothetical protein VGR46_07610 [Candidatus Limnocylindria bacterium]|jgi:hypothetical protein|nr:hypothetical protein [Candidatus Limnocylindria bacterium]